jgi:hypothetical protein
MIRISNAAALRSSTRDADRPIWVDAAIAIDDQGVGAGLLPNSCTETCVPGPIT